MTSHVMNTYGRLPITLVGGKGVRVWDDTGRQYLDFFSGIAVNTLGHGHEKLVAVLQKQVATLLHTSNYFVHKNQEELATHLAQLSQMDEIFFCSTGLEANEGAIKLARKFGHNRGCTNPKIVVFEHAFHGRSLATLAAGGNQKIQQGFGPLVEGFVRVPFNDPVNLAKIIDGNSDIVAVMLEPIQGEGGIYVASDTFLHQVRVLCDKHNLLFMVDEVQSGLGRTGKWFAHQWAGVRPDVMTLAKGLGSGIPIGALLARGSAAKVLGPGMHGSTFGGNHLATCAGIETLKIIIEENLLSKAALLGEHLIVQLKNYFADELAQGKIKAIRGKGLMVGMELNLPYPDLVLDCAKAGLLITVTADKVVRLLPALTITKEEIDEGVGILQKVLQAHLKILD